MSGMGKRQWISMLHTLLPALALALLLAAVFWRQPRAMSYFGINLLLNVAIPIMFATLAQMMVLAVSDLDLSIGPFVSLAACIGAAVMPDQPLLAIVALAASIGAYALAGAVIEWRQLPSIVVTLGLSFVWLGWAVLLLPTPGGTAPEWLRVAMRYKAPILPLPLWIALFGAALLSHHNGKHWGEQVPVAGSIQASMVSALPLPPKQRYQEKAVLASDNPSIAPTPPPPEPVKAKP